MRGAHGHFGRDPLLLALLGLGAGLALLASTARGREERAPACAASACTAPCDAGAVAAPGVEPFAGEREPIAARGPRLVAPAETETKTRAPAPAARGARKEREFLAEFLELEREHPGALEERAAAVLEGDGPAAEKVALLRALGAGEPGPHLAWLEHAARTLADESRPEQLAVARYAVDELVAARESRESRAALARLSFELPGFAPGLRRTAAVGLARDAGEPELGALRVALAREQDELLVAGVVAALRDRAECPQAARLAQEFRGSAPTE